MSDPVTGAGATTAEQVAYFVIRIRRDPTNATAELTGTLERLGSGRALHFGGAAELLDLLVGPGRESPRPSQQSSD